MDVVRPLEGALYTPAYRACLGRIVPAWDRGANALDNLLDGLPAEFACDEDAGVEDQSQGVSPMPTYRGACGCG